MTDVWNYDMVNNVFTYFKQSISNKKFLSKVSQYTVMKYRSKWLTMESNYSTISVNTTKHPYQPTKIFKKHRS